MAVSRSSPQTNVRSRGKTSKRDPIILSIDVGGSHVKIMTSEDRTLRRIDSDEQMSAADMVDKVRQLAAGLAYDCVSIGYPGQVHRNRIVADPHNLGSGWVGFDFDAAFGKPVKVVNDALMQALGSYKGGAMLFLGLGTGLGAALVIDGQPHPLEIAHLPYRKHSYEHYAGEDFLKRKGKPKWRRRVRDIVERFRPAFQVEYIVLGGGNAKHLDCLPPDTLLGDNANAFLGGFALWNKGEAKPAK